MTLAVHRIRPFRLEAVLFDFDGTLTAPGAIDFSAIRTALACPPGTPILEYIDTLESVQRRAELLEILDAFEIEAAASSLPNPGAEEAVRSARAKGVRVAVLSRNSRRSIARALENFPTLVEADFDLIVSRDDPPQVKPDPESVRYAARRLGISVENLLVVGDYLFDVQAGEAAGAFTCLLLNGQGAQGSAGGIPEHWQVSPDFVMNGLDDLEQVLRLGTAPPPGKLPNDLLELYLKDLVRDRREVLIPPGVGEDFAAVAFSGADVLLLKSDPITFTTQSPAGYAVTVNANDLATSGGRARWLLATWLFPPGKTAAQILTSMHELAEVCAQLDIAVVGGHTEITDAVTRPVVSCTLVGTVERPALLSKRDIAEGDVLLMTKGLAIEGTSIIARELGAELERLGMPASEVARAAALVEGLSVLPEARVALEVGGVAGLHDVTEGGVATALEELSHASGRKLEVELDKIPILAETMRVCDLLELHPLGLIGSGSLLIAVRASHAAGLLEALAAAGIAATAVGRARGEGYGVHALQGGLEAPFPRFETDEIARLFSSRRAGA
jgi:HAD superfamily hydrolase (TIGR01509 family)